MAIDSTKNKEMAEDPKTRCQNERKVVGEPRRRRPRLVAAKTLPNPTAYALALNGEYSDWAYDEDRARSERGRWRRVSGVNETHPLDIEIGTGNGYFFAHQATKEPGRTLMGIELKFKPLIQSIRRSLGAGNTNSRVVRYDASCIEDVFAEGELNNIYIHHPDPWPRQRDRKHRLIQAGFLRTLHGLMRPGSFVNFKTDSEAYFDWALPLISDSEFSLIRKTRDLHRSEWAKENFVTHFERLFMQRGQPIYYCRFEKSRGV